MSNSHWILCVFLLFSKNQEKNFASRSDPETYNMNLESLTYQILFRSLLDPLKESITLPIFGLYLLGYKNKLFPTCFNEEILENNVLQFLYFYAQKSPSIFFKHFQLSTFLPYFEEGQIFEDSLDEFSLLDLLFKIYFMYCNDENKFKNLGNIAFQTLHTLLYMRYSFKEEDCPEYIQVLRREKSQTIKESSLTQLLKLPEKELNEEKKQILPQLCKLLVSLVHASEHRRSILTFCESLIAAQIPNEKENLTNFIKNTKESLIQDPGQTVVQSISLTPLTKKNLLIPDLFDALSLLIDEIPENDLNLRALIQDSTSVKKDLESISLLYMEALEVILKLQEGYVVLHSKILNDIRKLVELPLKYYFYVLKLKDLSNFNTKSSSFDGKKGLEGLKRMASHVETGKVLERSFTSIRAENTNFTEIFPLWLTKNRTFINTVFDALNPVLMKQNLWMVKAFPWIMGFKSKETILMLVFFFFLFETF